ncbi:uncharacterized protein [Pyrus communis]|uniref:uncharacterized protein n=1 Tax=Pyrus communis TaxID=23211 RepID=UPI0035C075F8
MEKDLIGTWDLGKGKGRQQRSGKMVSSVTAGAGCCSVKVRKEYQRKGKIEGEELNMTATVVSTVLNRENYKDWSFRMKTYFLAEDLWDVVQGTVKEPPEGGEEHKAWKKKDAKALYAIHNSCGNDTYKFIKDDTTAHEAWLSFSWRLKGYEPPDEIDDDKTVDEAYPNTLESALEEGRSQLTTWHAEHDESVETVESNANHIRETFVKYVKSNDWVNAINLLRQHPQAGSERVLLDGTALHYAITTGCSERIMQELVELMATEHLEIQDLFGYTALYYLTSLFPERVQVAECMVKGNPSLLTILPSWSLKAQVVVAQGKTKGERMARYLYSLTQPKTIKVIDAAQLISDGFRFQRFDIAWDLIQRYPKLTIATNHDGDIPLGTLASNRFAFKSRRSLSLWEKLIYYGIRIKPLPPINKEKHESEQSDQRPLSDQKENKRHHLISSGNLHVCNPIWFANATTT